MKRLFSTRINENSAHLALLLIRVVTGIFMIIHGIPKLAKALDGNFKFGDPLGVGAEVSLALVIFAEVFCSLFVFLGFATRLATIPLIITMFVAGFMVHGADPFKKQEMALMYLLLYVVLMLLGSGKYSIDRLISKK